MSFELILEIIFFSSVINLNLRPFPLIQENKSLVKVHNMRFRDKKALIDYIKSIQQTQALTWAFISIFNNWNAREDLRKIAFECLCPVVVTERKGKTKILVEKAGFGELISREATMRNLLRTVLIGTFLPIFEAIDDYCREIKQLRLWGTSDRFYRFVYHVRNALTHDMIVQWFGKGPFPEGEWNGIIIDSSKIGKSISEVTQGTEILKLTNDLIKWAESNLS